MKRTLLVATLMALTLSFVNIADADKPRDKPWNAHDVMETAFKGKDTMFKRLTAGTAADDEKTLFLQMVQDIHKQDPPKGDADAWKGRVSKMVAAAQAIVDGDEGGPAQLKAASNCKDCHTAHRPPKD